MERKEQIKINLREALEQCDYYFRDSEVVWIVDMLMPDIQDWTYSNYSDFALDVANELGDYFYVLRQYDALPNVAENRSMVDKWLRDNKYPKMDYDDITGWALDHKEVYRDLLTYIKNGLNKK